MRKPTGYWPNTLKKLGFGRRRRRIGRHKTRQAQLETLEPRELLAADILREPTADAYVDNRTAFVDTNFGDDPSLVTFNSGGDQKESFLRFDLSDLPGDVTGATLLLRSTSFGTPNTNEIAQILGVEAEFVESTITWTNRPTNVGPDIDSRTIDDLGTVNIDVTTLVQNISKIGDMNLNGWLDPVGDPEGTDWLDTAEYLGDIEAFELAVTQPTEFFNRFGVSATDPDVVERADFSNDGILDAGDIAGFLAYHGLSQGDLTFDGLVDSSDITLILSANSFENPGAGPGPGDTWFYIHGDLNFDGVVDTSDISILLDLGQQPVTGPDPTIPSISFRISATDSSAEVTYGSREAGDPANRPQLVFQTNVSSSPWQNPSNPFDVNNDGAITQTDVDAVIDELTNRTISDPTTFALPDQLRTLSAPPPFLDVNGDGFATPIDALLVSATVNSTSVIDPDMFPVNEDVQLSDNVRTNDSDLGIIPDPIGAEVVPGSGPSNGNLALAADGLFTYTPNADFFGVDSFSYRLEDGTAITDAVTVTITVNPVNDPPTLAAIADPPAIDEDAGQQIVNLSGISAGGGETQQLMVTTTSSDPSLIPNPTVMYTSPDMTGSLLYTPAANLSGTAIITVTVTDAGLNGTFDGVDDGVFEQTFDVVVNPVNDPPVLAMNAGLTLDEGATATIGVTLLKVDDIDNTAAQIIFTMIVLPTGGTLKLNGTAIGLNGTVTQDDIDNNRLTYENDGSESTTDSFTFTVSDGSGGSIGATIFTITVNPVNDPPTLGAIADPPAIKEDTGPHTVNLSGISAGGGETQQLKVEATSSDPTLIPDPTVTYTSPDATGSLAYTPMSDQFGTATITVTVTDAGLDGTLGSGDDGFTQQSFDIVVQSVSEEAVRLPGDFDGDGRQEFIEWDGATGQWQVLDLTQEPVFGWGGWLPGINWNEAQVGDWNGDGLDDLAGRDSVSGEWQVAISTGSEFLRHDWGTLPVPTSSPILYVGDFDGDGQDDLLGWVPDATNGDRWQLLRYEPGGGQTASRWGTITELGGSANLAVADVNQDGRDDLLRRDGTNGPWHVALSQADDTTNEDDFDGFIFQDWGSWFDNWAVRDASGKITVDPKEPIQAVIDIFESVYNTVELQLYPGLMKGVQATLETQAGNPWDQAALLVDLLEADGIDIDADIATGRIDVPSQTIQDWLGAASSDGAEVLLKNGFNTVTSQVSRTVEPTGDHFQFDHAWVTAWLPGADGLGWRDLDPSWKFKDYQPGIEGLLDLVPFDEVTYLSQVREQLPYEFYEDQVADYLAVNHPGLSLADVAHDGPILTKTFDAIPAGLDYEIISSVNTIDNVAAAPLLNVHWVGLILELPDNPIPSFGTPLFDDEPRIRLPDDSLSRITLTYVTQPNNQVKAEWRIDGELKYVSNDIEQDADVRLVLVHFNPGSSQSSKIFSHNIRAGQSVAIGLDAQQFSQEHLARLRGELNGAILPLKATTPSAPGESIVGRTLNYALAKYWHDFGAQSRILSGLTGAINVHKRVGSGIAFSEPTVGYNWDLQIPAVPTNMAIDLANVVYLDVMPDGAIIDPRRGKIVSDISSALEHAVIEELVNTPSVSTIKGLQLAMESPTNEVYVLEKVANEDFIVKDLQGGIIASTETEQQIRTRLELDSVLGVENDIINLLDQSFIVTVPKKITDLELWDGAVYIAALTIPGVSAQYRNIIAGDFGSINGGFSFAPSVPPPSNPDGNTANAPSAGDPVNPANGNMFREELDIAIPNIGFPLIFARRYDSQNGEDIGLGVGWSHSYSDWLNLDDPSIEIVWTTSQGVRHTFTPDGAGGYDTPTTLHGTFTFSGGVYEFKNKNGTKHRFNSAGRLIKLSDRNGNALNISYDPANLDHISAVEDGTISARELTFTYTGDQITAVSDFTGRTWNYTYQTIDIADDPDINISMGNQKFLESVTSPSDAGTLPVVVEYDYYGSDGADPAPLDGLMKMIIEPNGGERTFTYYANRRTFQVTDPEGFTQHFSYDLFRGLTTFTDERGNTTSYIYDDDGQLIKQTQPDRTRDQYEWQDSLMTEHVNAVGETEMFQYFPDGLGNLQTTTSFDGIVTEFEYDANFSQVKKIIVNPGTDEQVTTFTINSSNGNVEEIIDPLNNKTTIGYFGNGLVQTRTQPKGVATPLAGDYTTTFVYNDAGQAETITTDLPSTVDNGYNDRGNLTTTTDATGIVTTLEYDLLGRLVKEKLPDPDGSIGPLGQAVTEFQYNAKGEFVSTIDPLGRVTHFTYDGQGRQTSAAAIDTLIPPINFNNYQFHDYAIGRQNNSGAIVGTLEDNGRTLPLTGSGWKEMDLDFEFDLTPDTVIEFDFKSTTEGDAHGIGLENNGFLSTSKFFQVYGTVNVALGSADGVPQYTGSGWQHFRIRLGDFDAFGYKPGKADRLVFLNENRETGFNGDSWFRNVTILQADSLLRSQYDAVGNLIASTDALDRTTDLVYDGRNRPIQTRLADGATTRTRYDATRRVLVSTDALGNTTEFAYDEAGRPTQVDGRLSIVPPVNFNDYVLESYDTAAHPDISTTTVLDADILKIEGSGWKALDLGESFEVTPDTVIEFDFRSDVEGRFHGVGFDDDLVRNSDRQFVVYGTAGNLPFDDSDGVERYSGSGWQHYKLRVGDFPTFALGTVQYLTFINDFSFETPPQNVESRFRNVQVYELVTTTSRYDEFGNLTSVEDAEGNATLLEYDELGRVVEIRSPKDGSFDAGGNFVGTTEYLAISTTDYDANGNVDKQIVYDVTGLPAANIPDDPSTLDPSLHRQIDFVYDVANRPIEVIDPALQSSFTTYDAAGRVLTTTDRLDRTTEFRYDGLGRLVQEILPGVLLGSDEFTRSEVGDDWTNDLGMWEIFNDRLKVANDNVNDPRVIFDRAPTSMNYTVEVESQSSLFNASSPVAEPGLVAQWHDDNNFTFMQIELLGENPDRYFLRLLSVKSGQAPIWSIWEVDPAIDGVYHLSLKVEGNVLTPFVNNVELGTVEHHSFDTPGQVGLRVNGSSSSFASFDDFQLTEHPVTIFAYDAVGNTIAVTDTLDNVTTFEYDRYNRLARTTDAEGGVTKRVYDAAGQLVLAVNALGHASVNAYDRRGRLVRQTLPDPDGDGLQLPPITRFTYDAAGQLTDQTDPLGRVIALEYDELGRETRFDERLHSVPLLDFNDVVVERYDIPNHPDSSSLEILDGGSTLRIDGSGWKMIELGESFEVTPDTVIEFDFKSGTEGRFHGIGLDDDNILSSEKTFVFYGTATNFGLNEADGVERYSGSGWQHFRFRVGDFDDFDYDFSLNAGLTKVLTFISDNTADPANVESLFRNVEVYELLTTTTTYDQTGNLLTTTDPLGRTTTFAYDALGRLLTETLPDPDGPSGTGGPGGSNLSAPITTFTYDTLGNLISTQDLGRTTTFEYDALGRQTKETLPDPDGPGGMPAPVTTFTYDAVGQLISQTDPLGRVTAFEYDALDRQTKETLPDPDGPGSLPAPVTTFTYDAVGNLITSTDVLGRETTFEYDKLGRLTKETLPNPDSASPVLFMVAQTQSVNVFYPNVLTFDFSGTPVPTGPGTLQVTAVADLDASFEFLTLDAEGIFSDDLFIYSGLELSEVTATFNLTQSQLTTLATDGTISFTVTPSIEVHDIAGTEELTLELSYPISSGPFTVFEYDAVGNLVSVLDAEDQTTTSEYDRLGRLVKETLPDPDGPGPKHALETVFTYDTVGNLLTEAIVDVDGDLSGDLVTSFTYDDLDRQTSIVAPNSDTTVFAYDAVGNLASTTDGAQNTTSFFYDDLDRLVQETNAFGKSRLFTYYVEGNLHVAVDRNGRLRVFEYDQLDRLIEERWRVSQQDLTLVNTINSTYDEIGRLKSIGDNSFTDSFRYDKLDRLTEHIRGDVGGQQLVVFGYNYNDSGNLWFISELIDNVLVSFRTYNFDGLDRTTMVLQEPAFDFTNTKRVQFTYDNLGNFKTITRKINGIDFESADLVTTSTYDYDLAHRLTSLSHDVGAASPIDYSFAYDAASRIVDFTSPDGTNAIGYDAAGQLTSASLTAEAYTYDDNGNRTNTGYTTGTNNQITADGTFTYDYDDEGNVLFRTRILLDPADDFQTVYTWDHRNRLTRVMDKNNAGFATKTVNYTYDANDLRITKQVDEGDNGTIDSAERYVYDRGDLTTVFDDLVLQTVNDKEDAVTHRYLHGPAVDQILAEEQYDPSNLTAPRDVLWPLADHQGTVRDVASYDEVTDTTTIRKHVEYDTFGNISGEDHFDSAGNPIADTDPEAVDHAFGFTGRAWDDDVDLYYYRARWYDPAVGRFITEDPIGFDAGDANLYRYVSNSPLNFTDPSGLSQVTPLQEILGGFGPSTQLSPLSILGPTIPPPLSSPGLFSSFDTGPAPFDNFDLGFFDDLDFSNTIDVSAQPFQGPAITSIRMLEPLRIGSLIREESQIRAENLFSKAFAPETFGDTLLAPFNFADAVLTSFAGTAVGFVVDLALAEPAPATIVDFADGTTMLTLGGISTEEFAGPGILLGPPFVRAVGVANIAARGATTGANVARGVTGRLPQDINVTPIPPAVKPLNRNISQSVKQNARVQRDAARLEQAGARDVRINQQQVNAAGKRVGINRPDLQYTNPKTGQRVTIEYESTGSTRGAVHNQRILTNDPKARVIIRENSN